MHGKINVNNGHSRWHLQKIDYILNIGNSYFLLLLNSYRAWTNSTRVDALIIINNFLFNLTVITSCNPIIKSRQQQNPLTVTPRSNLEGRYS